jgi:hypothetical protein
MTKDASIIGLTNIIHDQSARNVELIYEAASANRAGRQALADAEARAARQRILDQAPKPGLLARSVLDQEEQRHSEQIQSIGAKMAKMNEEMKQKDELILDWKISNASFKRLAQKYAKAQGVSAEQFDLDLKEEQENAAEEIPRPPKEVVSSVPRRTMADDWEELVALKKAEQERRAQAIKKAME